MYAPVTTERLVLADIPVLHCYPTELKGPAPTIFFYHGWTSTKDRQTIVGEALAAKGFRAILPEAIHHGEREAFADYNKPEAQQQFSKVLTQTILEFDAIYKAAAAAEFVDTERVGVAGHSMGGMITAGIMARYEWPKAGALLNGCPTYTWFEDYSRKKQGFPPATEAELAQTRAFDPEFATHRIAPRPFLMLHAQGDPTVPVEGVRRFYDLAKGAYEGHSDHLVLHEYEWDFHAVSHYMVYDLRQWFLKHLTK